MGTDGSKIGRSSNSNRGGVGRGAGGAFKRVAPGKLNIGRRSLTRGPQGAQRQAVARRVRSAISRVGGPRAGRGYVSWNQTRFANPSTITTGTYRAGSRNEARRLTSARARAQYRDSGFSVGKPRVIGQTAGGKNVWGFSVRGRPL